MVSLRLPVAALAACGVALQAAEPPAWWKSFLAAPRMESRFTQESESAVFGKLQKSGVIRISKGGRLRVEYRRGLLLVADGRTLVQYDAAARTAQKVDLRSAARDAPLVSVLLDPRTLAQVYDFRPGPSADAFTLEPRKPGPPRVVLEGRDGLPRRISWTDPTGAQQVLLFLDPKVPGAPFPASDFRFTAPKGTRWIDALS